MVTSSPQTHIYHVRHQERMIPERPKLREKEEAKKSILFLLAFVRFASQLINYIVMGEEEKDIMIGTAWVKCSLPDPSLVYKKMAAHSQNARCKRMLL